MAKLPAFQFYPGDWLQDAIAGCSLAAQGLWLRMMFVAHNSDKRGYLTQNGLPLPSQTIAILCGCADFGEFKTLLDELDRAGIPSRTKTGAIYSRRMVRDEKSRLANKFRQQDFRNKNGKVLSDIAPGLTENAHIPNKTKENSNAFVTPMSHVTGALQENAGFSAENGPFFPDVTKALNTKANTNTKTKTKAKATPPAFVLPDWVPQDAWEGFVAMRSRIRAPLTDRAKQGIVRDLDRLRTEGCAVAEVLNQSEKLAWRGVFRLRQGDGDLNATRRPVAENFPRNPQPETDAREEYDRNMREYFWPKVRDWTRKYDSDLQKQIVAWGKVNDPEGYARWVSECEPQPSWEQS